LCLAKSRRQSVSRALNQLNRPSSVADRNRACALRGGRDGRASPTPCPMRPERAGARHLKPLNATKSPTCATFPFSSPASHSLTRSAALRHCSRAPRRHPARSPPRQYRLHLARSFPVASFSSSTSSLSRRTKVVAVFYFRRRPDLVGVGARRGRPPPKPSHSPLYHPLVSPCALEASTELSCALHGRTSPEHRRTSSTIRHACCHRV